MIITNDPRNEVIAKIEIETAEVISDHQRERLESIETSLTNLSNLLSKQHSLLTALRVLETVMTNNGPKN